jgi:hypothetical protein
MSNLDIDKLLVIDSTGMPQAPGIRQLVDKDIALLWQRDTTKDKRNYIAQCGIIYYLGDPKSPARQQGLSDREALNMAIEQFDLPKDYAPDPLVKKLIDKYYKQNITEAGIAIENLNKSIHLISLAANKINDLLNAKLTQNIVEEDIAGVLALIDSVAKKITEVPSLVKALGVAYENLRTEEETKMARGGMIISSNMNADDN